MDNPETLRLGSFFRYRDLTDDEVQALRTEFSEAEPFPHLAIADFVKISPQAVCEAFPKPEWDGWSRFEDSYQASKRFCQDIDRIPALAAAMIHDLSSPAFLEFLETVTGIPRLLPDPYLEGAGLHMSGPGGVLLPHTDFHSYLRLNLYRRINVLVYLTPEWRPKYGGCLELYEKGSQIAARTIVPTWGTFVVFRTDDSSVHGFSKPIAEGRWRRSIALYYYTSDEAEDFSGDETTHWQAHGRHTPTGRARLWLYKFFLRGSRACSRLAHQVNPNLGEALRPKVGLVLGAAIGFLVGLGAGGAGAFVAGTSEGVSPTVVLLGVTLVGMLVGACAGYSRARSDGRQRSEN